MKQVMTKYTCDRCGNAEERPGEDADKPAGWRYVIMDSAGPELEARVSQTTEAPDWKLCCNGCVKGFSMWFAEPDQKRAILRERD